MPALASMPVSDQSRARGNCFLETKTGSGPGIVCARPVSSVPALEAALIYKAALIREESPGITPQALPDSLNGLGGFSSDQYFAITVSYQLNW
jgi:hypothetical protein